MEFVINYIANTNCLCDSCKESETQKLVVILDARGIGMRDLAGEVLEFVRCCTSVMQKHYPQRSFKIFMINVPSWFGMIWKIVKPLLNETTKAKTSILTENDVAEALLEWIDPENLPLEYGGTCACPGGCFENSSFQQMQQALVESILEEKPFEPENYQTWPSELCCDLDKELHVDGYVDGDSSEDDEACAMNEPAVVDKKFFAKKSEKSEKSEKSRFNLLNLVKGDENANNSKTESQQENASTEVLSPGTGGRSEVSPVRKYTGPISPLGQPTHVLKQGYLLMRSVKHKNFNPIWLRRYFTLTRT